MNDPIETAVQAFFNQGRKATSAERMKAAIATYYATDESRVMSADQFALQCAALDLKDAKIEMENLRGVVESLFFAHAYNDHASVGARIDELCRLMKCGHYGSDDP